MIRQLKWNSERVLGCWCLKYIDAKFCSFNFINCSFSKTCSDFQASSTYRHNTLTLWTDQLQFWFQRWSYLETWPNNNMLGCPRICFFIFCAEHIIPYLSDNNISRVEEHYTSVKKWLSYTLSSKFSYMILIWNANLDFSNSCSFQCEIEISSRLLYYICPKRILDFF